MFCLTELSVACLDTGLRRQSRFLGLVNTRAAAPLPVAFPSVGGSSLCLGEIASSFPKIGNLIVKADLPGTNMDGTRYLSDPNALPPLE